MKELTICLMTCGEHTEAECLKAVEPWLDQCSFCEVRNVYPQIKALNQMIDQVWTEFFIPLDADMILNPNAYDRIKNAINKHRRNGQWHAILFPLWDTLTEKKILALKVLRTGIFKEIPFEESPTPDVSHYKTITDAGYTTIHDYLRQHPIGNHVVRGHHFCYHKYRDVYQTYRAHNFEWDSGAFFGGYDLRSRSKAHFDFFFSKWLETRNEDYLSCIAGMWEGIAFPLEYKSKTLEHTGEYAVSNSNAPPEYMRWHAEQSPALSAEALF